VYEGTAGALLLERLIPGHSLVQLTLEGRDDEATDVIASVIRQMDAVQHVPASCPPAHQWGRSFERYLASGSDLIARELVADAARWFQYLARTQRDVRLLHGDLHHDNVLFDIHRGWVAIDPKGVVGEREYEIGAALRNPCDRPDLFLPLDTIERRLTRFVTTLDLDAARARQWAFAQAVLSAVWMVEDREPMGGSTPVIQLATTIRSTLPSPP